MAYTSDTLYLQFALRNTSAEFCVNGIPVWTIPKDPGAEEQTIPINAFVVPGENRIEAILDLEGSPSASRTPRNAKAKPGSWVEFRVLRMPSGRGPQFPSPSSGSVLCERGFRADKKPGEPEEPEVAPRWVSASFESPGYGAWAWQSAKKLELDVATIEEARVACEAVRSALRSGDTRALLQLIDVRFRESGRAFGVTDDSEDVAQLERWIQQYREHPERVLPLAPTEFDFRLVADGRILVPLYRDWSHAIRLRQPVTDQHGRPVGDVVGRYAIMLAHVGGGLRIVR